MNRQGRLQPLYHYYRQVPRRPLFVKYPFGSPSFGYHRRELLSKRVSLTPSTSSTRTAKFVFHRLQNRQVPRRYENNYPRRAFCQVPLPSTSEEQGFAEYPFVLSRPSSPSTTSARLRGLYQVPLRFVETGKSEDPMYHDDP